MTACSVAQIATVFAVGFGAGCIAAVIAGMCLIAAMGAVGRKGGGRG